MNDGQICYFRDPRYKNFPEEHSPGLPKTSWLWRSWWAPPIILTLLRHCTVVPSTFILLKLDFLTLIYRSGSKTVAQDGANMRSRTNPLQFSLLQRRCQPTVKTSHRPCSSRLLPFSRLWANSISDRGAQCTLRFLWTLVCFKPVIRLDQQFRTEISRLLVWWSVNVYLLQQALRSVPVSHLSPALSRSTKPPVTRIIEKVATLQTII